MKRAAIVVASLVILSACSPGAQRFEAIGSLHAALRREGFRCQNFRELPGSRLVAERAACDVSGSTITLYVFDSSAEFRRWKPVGGAFGHVVVGPNWAVTGPDEAVMERVRDQLHASAV